MQPFPDVCVTVQAVDSTYGAVLVGGRIACATQASLPTFTL
jgi:hypothetical protein